jgi:hypothetical protein
MKPYVGMAKKLPLSRTPRRFIAASSNTKTMATVASCPISEGIAAAAF